jgi:hypothetical protein
MFFSPRGSGGTYKRVLSSEFYSDRSEEDAKVVRSIKGSLWNA